MPPEPLTLETDARILQHILKLMAAHILLHSPRGRGIHLRVSSARQDQTAFGPGPAPGVLFWVQPAASEGQGPPPARAPEGVGVSLAARLAALLGGRLEVEAGQEGQAGYRLLLWLPVSTAPRPRESPGMAPDPSPSRSPSISPRPQQA